MVICKALRLSQYNIRVCRRRTSMPYRMKESYVSSANIDVIAQYFTSTLDKTITSYLFAL
jgi:hypothetical protein